MKQQATSGLLIQAPQKWGWAKRKRTERERTRYRHFLNLSHSVSILLSFSICISPSLSLCLYPSPSQSVTLPPSLSFLLFLTSFTLVNSLSQIHRYGLSFYCSCLWTWWLISSYKGFLYRHIETIPNNFYIEIFI